MATLPAGAILLWSGSIATIPAGYVLCNGANGTPDLRDRFVPGAGNTYDPDDSGGASSHSHDFIGDGHTHSISPGTGMEIGTTYEAATDIDFAEGTTDPENHLPPYYALAYIMKT